MFLLAHLSDVHLGPMPPATLSQLLGKRISGHQSWHRNRHAIHSHAVADLLRQHVKKAKPDHVAITGDLVNIALPQEFINAKRWLNDFGPGDWISVVPGNHDAYVPMPTDQSLGLWREYMTDTSSEETSPDTSAIQFPYVRHRGDIALIGVSTGIPTLPFVAGGRIGTAQLNALEAILAELGKQNKCRVIMIHHPPLTGQNRWRKALWDARELENILQRQGAELILHGHNHIHMFATTPGPQKAIPVYGVPAASLRAHQTKPAAHYYLFAIEKQNDARIIQASHHGLTPDESRFEDLGALPSS